MLERLRRLWSPTAASSDATSTAVAAADGSGAGTGGAAAVASAVALPLAGAVIGGTVLGPAGVLLGTSFAGYCRRVPWRIGAHALVAIVEPSDAAAQASRARR